MRINDIELENLDDSNSLFFIRIRGKKSYFNSVYGERFLGLLPNVAKYPTISEYRKDADVYIDLRSVNRDYLTETEFRALESLCSEGEIISRCRGLRAIPLVESRKLIARCFLFFNQFYADNPSVKYIVMGAIDNYVMHLMYLVGSSLNIHFVPVTGSFMSPAYNLISLKGELNEVKGDTAALSPDELKKFINGSLSQTPRPKALRIARGLLYDYLSYKYRYIFRYLLQHKCMGSLEYEDRFAPFLAGFKSIRQLRAYRHFRKEIDSSSGKPLVYVPLHWYPEATTDYWVNDHFHSAYYTSLFSTLQFLKEQDFEVIVKEHPHFAFKRELWPFDELHRLGVQVLSPWVKTSDIFDAVESVVVWNGSTGVEALVYGCDVYTVTNSYYGDGILPCLSEIVRDAARSADKGKMIESIVKRVAKTSISTQ